MNLKWRVLDWVRSKDEPLIIDDDNQNYSVDWEEVKCLPEFWLGELRCKLFNRHGMPFFGRCLYCGEELLPGDYIGWFHRYDPDEDAGNILMDILPGMITFGAIAKKQKAYSDFDKIYKEAHK